MPYCLGNVLHCQHMSRKLGIPNVDSPLIWFPLAQPAICLIEGAGVEKDVDLISRGVINLDRAFWFMLTVSSFLDGWLRFSVQCIHLHTTARARTAQNQLCLEDNSRKSDPYFTECDCFVIAAWQPVL